jgi:ABC-type antimicrobial peptide transport system permease subunit
VSNRDHIAWAANKDLLQSRKACGGPRLAAIGAAIGVGGSLLLFQLFGTLLFGVTPYDLSTYTTALALLGAVAGLASYVPARRAARIEPLVALRQE